MIGKLVEDIDRRAAKVVDDACEKGEVEFVCEVAAQVPVQMICEMIGLEPDVWPRMYELSNLLIGSADDPEYVGMGEHAAAEVYALCDTVAADRRVNPRADHAGRRRQRDDPQPHQPLDAGAHRPPRPGPAPAGRPGAVGPPASRRCCASAARSTTSAARPRATPRSGACRSPRATRSSSTTPPPTATRTCSTTPTPSTWAARPTTTRPPGRGGVHFCLGASLARAEIRATMRQLVERLPDIEFAGPVDRLHSDFVNGIKRMPVRFTPAPPAS